MKKENLLSGELNPTVHWTCQVILNLMVYLQNQEKTSNTKKKKKSLHKFSSYLFGGFK